MNCNRLTKVVFTHGKKSRLSIESAAIEKFKDLGVNCDLKGIESKYEIKKHVKIVINQIDMDGQLEWYRDIWDDSKSPENGNKLRLYRLYKERMVPDFYVKRSMPRHYRQTLSKFRSGTLPIGIETGRYMNLPLNERTCNVCASGAVENEVHVLIDCELYDDLRYELLNHMHNIYEDFSMLPSLTKFLSIMSSDSCQFLIAKYLICMMQRRRLYIFN